MRAVIFLALLITAVLIPAKATSVLASRNMVESCVNFKGRDIGNSIVTDTPIYFSNINKLAVTASHAIISNVD